MLRALLLVALVLSLSHAKWCVFYASQTKIYGNEDQRFTKRFKDAKVLHDGEYYRFVIGPYEDRKEAIRWLKKARRYKKDAFIRRCDGLFEQDIQEKSALKEVGSQPIRLKKDSEVLRKLETNATQKEVVISEVFKRPILKQRKKVIHFQKKRDLVAQKRSKKIVKKEKSFAIKKKTRDDEVAKKSLERLEKEPFYRLNYYEFMDRFLFKSPYGKVEDYNYRLQKLDALLEDVPYNWDLFLHGAVRYMKFIDFTLNNNKELSLQGGVGVSKRLFDSGYYIKSSIKRLRQKLAKIDYINAKDRLYLYGSELYINALLQQKIKELYEESFYEQKAFKELVKERYKASVVSRVDDIDAEDDFLNIKKNLLQKVYAYLYSDYLLRNAAELNITKPLKLSWFGVSLDKDKKLRQYYQNALSHSPKILSQELRKELARKRIAKFRYFYLPQVDFNGLIYGEYRKDYGQIIGDDTASGINYEARLNIKVPLYNKTTLDELERQKVRTLQQNERLKTVVKDLLKDIHKTFNELKKLHIKKDIVQRQLSLAKEKMELTKKRYLGGIGSYRDYSDAINEMLNYQQELYEIDAQILSNKIFLNLLEGIDRPYE